MSAPTLSVRPVVLRLTVPAPIRKKAWKHRGKPNYRVALVYYGQPRRHPVPIRDVPAWRPLDTLLSISPLEFQVTARIEVTVGGRGPELSIVRYPETLRRVDDPAARVDPPSLTAVPAAPAADAQTPQAAGPAAAPAAPGPARPTPQQEDDLATTAKNAGPVPDLPAPPKAPPAAAADQSLYVPGTYVGADHPLVRYQPDPVFEAELARLHIPFRLVPAYPLVKVDVDASLANTARPMQVGGLDAERVTQIVGMLRTTPAVLWKPLAGVENPAFMSPRSPSAPLVLLGGNHRRAGLAEVGIPQAAVYLIDAAIGELNFKALAAFHNQGEGQGISERQRLELAYNEAAQVYRAGTRPEFEKISVRWGVSVKGSLSRLFNIRNLQARFSGTGDMAIPNYERLSETVLNILHTGLKYNDSIKQIAKGVAEMRVMPPTEQIRALVTAMRAEPDAARRRALVESRLDALKANSGTLSRLMIDTKMRRADSMIRMAAASLASLIGRRLPASRDAKDVIPDPTDREALRTALAALQDRLAVEIARLS